MILKYCGSQIASGEGAGILDKIRKYTKERKVAVAVADEGLELILRG
jgi:hypothetical protein